MNTQYAAPAIYTVQRGQRHERGALRVRAPVGALQASCGGHYDVSSIEPSVYIRGRGPSLRSGPRAAADESSEEFFDFPTIQLPRPQPPPSDGEERKLDGPGSASFGG